MPLISKRATGFPSNPIRGLEPLVRDAVSRGINVIPLNIGAPDTASPLEVKDSIVNYLKKTDSIPYGPSVGNYKLIKELVQFYKTKYKFTDIEEGNIAITQGASEALDIILYTIADSGDTISTFDPTYPNYLSIAYKHGIKVSPIKTELSNSFHFDSTILEKYLPENTKAIIWSSPSNPTGAVYTREELNSILVVARKRNLWLIADEVYRSLDFTTKQEGFDRSLSIFDIATKEDRERIIGLDSMSKLLGVCGARIGAVIADMEIIKTLVKQASVRGSASTISQAGIESINDIPLSYFEKYNNEFKKRRNVLYNELKKLEPLGVKISPTPPEGAFYMIADLGVNAEIFTKWLITDFPDISKSKETVFLTPMTTENGGFYINKDIGKGEVRIAYVINEKLLKQSVKIIENALKLYKSLNH